MHAALAEMARDRRRQHAAADDIDREISGRKRAAWSSFLVVSILLDHRAARIRMGIRRET
ncbi:MAG TPA: hypothetical protein VMK05_11505 [Burkholderiales bacterium]|nr:hypothetical protein [Burkholderiales bacterium]